MNPKPIEQAKTPDLAKSMPALRRAAQKARELARETKPEVPIQRNSVTWKRGLSRIARKRKLAIKLPSLIGAGIMGCTYCNHGSIHVLNLGNQTG